MERGLTALLQEKGVASDEAAQRARNISRIGAPAVLNAMQGPNPWKQLKQLANQCTPVYQWVLPSELQQLVQARLENGAPLPSRKKAGKKPAKASVRQAPAAPVRLLPEQFSLQKGVFVAGSPAQELGPLAMSEVGSDAVGVIMTTREQAEPYLQLARPVSSAPLTLLLLGEEDVTTLPCQAARVQFPATCQATGEPGPNWFGACGKVRACLHHKD